ncbi:hypothetical protein Q3O98_20570, partial [Ralstonia pseudosolanacearum]|uniref:hypothetical protein n=1 Tax=Ralstonia pseudosolanacearum TaxID=1310165 RepID=UPI002675C1CB
MGGVSCFGFSLWFALVVNPLFRPLPGRGLVVHPLFRPLPGRGLVVHPLFHPLPGLTHFLCLAKESKQRKAR